MVLCIKEIHQCSPWYSRSVYLETIAVEYHTCRVVADRCVFLSLLSSSRVCFGLRPVWLAVWLAVLLAVWLVCASDHNGGIDIFCGLEAILELYSLKALFEL